METLKRKKKVHHQIVSVWNNDCDMNTARCIIVGTRQDQRVGPGHAQTHVTTRISKNLVFVNICELKVNATVNSYEMEPNLIAFGTWWSLIQNHLHLRPRLRYFCLHLKSPAIHHLPLPRPDPWLQRYLC